MITPVCTWWPILAQTLAANTCFQHNNGPMLCRILVYSLPKWFALVKVTYDAVMCRPWVGFWLFYFRNWMPYLKVTIGLVLGRYWAKIRLKIGKFKKSTKASVLGPALGRFKRRDWHNNNSRLLAPKIGSILCRITSFGNSHLERSSSHG